MAEPIPIQAPTAGVRPDKDPENLAEGELASAENMIYRDGDFRVRPGFAAVANNIAERPMSYFQYEGINGTVKMIQGTNRGWRNLLGNVWTNISGTALTATDASQPPIFRTFSKAAVTYLLGVNNKDSMKKWDGVASTYSAVGGSPPVARCMGVIFDRIVLANLSSGDTISPLAIDVSANKDFDAGWGEFVVLLADTAGAIVAIQEMGTLQGAILKTDAVCLLIAQGGVDPFRIQWVKVGISGPASTLLSFKTLDGQVGWMAKDGAVSMFDGASVQPLPYYIQKQIISTANPERIGRGWAAYDSDRRELWLIYPLLGSTEPNGGVMINMVTLQVYPIRFSALKMTAGAKLKTDTGLTIGDLNMQIGAISQTLGELGSQAAIRRLVVGDIGGQSYQDVGNTDNAAAIPAFWESPVVGQAERFTTIGRIRHRFKPSTATMAVQIGKRNEAGPVTFGTAKTINLNSMRRKVTGHRVTREYFSLRYSGNVSDEVIYQGAAAYGTKRGKR